jgi:hypothetical protein
MRTLISLLLLSLFIAGCAFHLGSGGPSGPRPPWPHGEMYSIQIPFSPSEDSRAWKRYQADQRVFSATVRKFAKEHGFIKWPTEESYGFFGPPIRIFYSERVRLLVYAPPNRPFSWLVVQRSDPDYVVRYDRLLRAKVYPQAGPAGRKEEFEELVNSLVATVREALPDRIEVKDDSN